MENINYSEDEKYDLIFNMIEIINKPFDKIDIIRNLLTLLKKFTKIEAIGIRLVGGEDYPYYTTEGFPKYFVKMENSLCSKDEDGQIIRDEAGNPVLECMCGNVLKCRTNPDFDFFTNGGSFWSNNTTKLLASTTDEDRQTRTRNRCNGEGYESVALIPIRSKSAIIGLLQLNDSRTGRFTLDFIHFIEKICKIIGIAYESKINFENLLYLGELRVSEMNLLKLNKKLETALESLREASTLKDEFLHTITHELRTPLNGILGFSSLIEEMEDLPEEAIQFIQFIKNDGNRLLNLVNDILDMSNLQRGSFSIKEIKTNIKELFNCLIHETEIETERKGLHFKFSIDNNVPDFIYTDKTRFTQIVSNLLDNAIKYTNEGMIGLTVGVDNDILYTCVEDTGIGIEEKYLGKIFEPFFQVNDRNKKIANNSSGIGLSISKKMSNILGGNIIAKSKRGVGTIFIFSLSIKDYQKYEPDNNENVVPFGINGKISLPKTVLIADDDFNCSVLFENYILSHFKDVEILKAANGLEVLEEFENNHNIDLVFLDIRMPLMDGYEAYQKLKSKTTEFSVPVIAISAYAKESDRKKCMEMGFNDFISKPANKKQIISILKNYLHCA